VYKRQPFQVQDRRRKGFFMIDNEFIDRFGPLIGAGGIAVVNVLARFANQESACFPSQSTIARLTALSRMQVSREIKKLKGLGLIAVEQQFAPNGAQRSNLYILLDLPPVTERDTPCNRQLHPPVTDSDTPCNRQLQQNKTQKNKTQRGQDKQKHKRRRRRKKQAPADNDVVVALVDLGISEKVAQYLAGQYNPEKITEKMGYLAFLEEQQPERVKNPCGWLRTAIIDDYGKPDGFVPKSEREQLAVEEERRAQEEKQQAQAVEQQRQTFQEKIQAEREAAILKLRAEYGTTEEDAAFWEAAQREIKTTMLPNMAELVRDAEILRVKDDTVVIGVQRKGDWLQLQHPGTQKAIKRALAYVANQEVELEAVHCPGL